MHSTVLIINNMLFPPAHSFEEGVASIAILRKELVEMKGILSECVSPIVFCHNDLLCGNFIYDEDKGMKKPVVLV